MMSRDVKMCILDEAVVEGMRQIAGTQAEIMICLGISWNSWIKIEGGLPIRLSVGERLRARVLERIADMPALEEKFRFCRCRSNGMIDRRALEKRFLKPVTIRGGSGPGPRSVRQARLLAAKAEQVTP